MRDFHEKRRAELVRLLEKHNTSWQSIPEFLPVSIHTARSWVLPWTSKAARTISAVAMAHLRVKLAEVGK